jgi:hypothetical protein
MFARAKNGRGRDDAGMISPAVPAAAKLDRLLIVARSVGLGRFGLVADEILDLFALVGIQ